MFKKFLVVCGLVLAASVCNAQTINVQGGPVQVQVNTRMARPHFYSHSHRPYVRVAPRPRVIYRNYYYSYPVYVYPQPVYRYEPVFPRLGVYWRY